MVSNAAVHPTLAASDIERAKTFYSQTLGLKLVHEDTGGVEYACGGGTSLFVYPSAYAGTNKATAAEFRVDDLKAAMRELRGKGVSFEEYDLPGFKTEDGVATYQGGKGAWFKDSEGNILALGQHD